MKICHTSDFYFHQLPAAPRLQVLGVSESGLVKYFCRLRPCLQASATEKKLIKIQLLLLVKIWVFAFQTGAIVITVWPPLHLILQ